MKEMWRSSFTLRAFFKPDVSSQVVESMRDKIENWSSVQEVTIVEQEEAHQRFLLYFGLSEEDLPVEENPFPASLEILPHRLEDLPALAREIKKIEVFDEVVYGGKNTENLLRFYHFFIRVGSIILLGVFIFVLLVIVSITGFRVRFHAEEIQVLRLMGATNRQIRFSFLGEGLIEGLLGGMSALVVSSLAFRVLLDFLHTSFPTFFWVKLEDFFLPLFIINVMMSSILSLVGTVVATRSLLRDKA